MSRDGFDAFAFHDDMDDPPRIVRLRNACPKCARQVTWCDGEPTPALVYRQRDGSLLARQVTAGDSFDGCVGCELCMARKRAPAEPPSRPRVVVEMRETPAQNRPEQSLREDFAAVVDWVGQGVDHFDRLARFLRKL